MLFLPQAIINFYSQKDAKYFGFNGMAIIQGQICL